MIDLSKMTVAEIRTNISVKLPSSCKKQVAAVMDSSSREMEAFFLELLRKAFVDKRLPSELHSVIFRSSSGRHGPISVNLWALTTLEIPLKQEDVCEISLQITYDE
jgi:hypothetical protein